MTGFTSMMNQTSFCCSNAAASSSARICRIMDIAILAVSIIALLHVSLLILA